ncbi:MAG TPA: GTPase [Mycoplasmatales bacterium]|jgi:small GTP-binding protein|nr:GTPase [Mycoplasmatales bacterium]
MKISIFGEDNIKKAKFINLVFNSFDIEEKNKIGEFQSNYIEYSMNSIELREFKLVNLPSINIESNLDISLKNEIIENNKLIIKNSDFVILLLESNSKLETFLPLLKVIDKNKKKLSLVWIDEIKVYEIQKSFSFNHKKTYKIPISYKSKSLIRNFFKEEFEITNFIKVKKERNVKIVIVGPENSGKSSFFNSVLGYDRSLVSKFAGTTKEQILSFFKFKDLDIDISIFDTKGLEKNKDVYNITSIKDCNITFLIIDATKQITKDTLKVIDFSQKINNSLLILMNKIDLINNPEEIKEKINEIRSRLKSYFFVPIIPISAKEKSNFDLIRKKVGSMIQQSKILLTKKEVSNYIENLIEKNKPPLIKGKRFKMYYGFHESGLTHKIILFVNDPKSLHFSYQRYIINSIRRYSGIIDLPIKIFLKKS